jgi:hypothetical protein
VRCVTLSAISVMTRKARGKHRRGAKTREAVRSKEGISKRDRSEEGRSKRDRRKGGRSKGTKQRWEGFQTVLYNAIWGALHSCSVLKLCFLMLDHFFSPPADCRECDLARTSFEASFIITVHFPSILLVNSTSVPRGVMGCWIV